MKIRVLIVLLFSNLIYSQISTSVVEITKPYPSVANLMNLVDIPVNTHTGVPNINIPLINIPTTSKNVNVNVGLSYHSAGIAFTNSASDVGAGWNLMAGGVISRTVTDLPDEYVKAYYLGLGGTINDVKFNDIYNYNFMGYSGKFKIVYKPSNNTVEIQKLDLNSIEITCEMSPDNQRVLSFTLYDDKGLKYIFNVKDRNKTFFLNRTWLNSQITITEPSVPYPDPYYYDSAYHLSEVYDNNNVKLVNLFYTPQVKGTNSSESHNQVTNKLNYIESLNFGTILFDYQYTASLENTLNDPFMLNNIILKNKKDEIINTFNLNYYFLEIKEARRHLYKIKKIGTGTQKTEEHEFEYQTDIINTSPFYCNNEDFYYGIDKFGYLNLTGNPSFTDEFSEQVTDGMFYEDFNERTSKDACLYGILKKILFPTGGKTEFEFESNTFRYSPNLYDLNQNYLHQYDIENTDNHIYTQIYNLNYNTNHGNQFPLVISGSEPVKCFIKLYPVAYYSQLNDPVDEPLYASFRLLGNGINQLLERTTATCLGDFIVLEPGNYTIQVNSLEYSIGQIIITKKELTTQPLREWVYGGGLRIKSIAHFNSYYDSTPQRNINYEYTMFNDSNLTSGELYDGFYRSYATNKATAAQVSYKNVKIFDTQNNGYTKHTYEGYTDSPYYANSISLGYFQNYFGYKNGVLKKVEVFNSNNDILKETENQYEFTESGSAMYVNSMLDYNFGWFYVRPCWSKLVSSNNKDYFYPQNSSTPSIVETTETYSYNPLNKQIAENTVTTSDGEILKTNYYYHRGNSIYSQNRISEIERVETYRNNELLSTSKINYANNWGTNVSYLPQTIQTSKGSLSLENRVRYTAYDSYGHPMEVQQENGMPISYLWGYDHSQPIAKIENATNAELKSALGVTDLTTINESNMTAINNLRINTSMANKLITTYTYIPLVGVSSITDPKGDKITYEYDAFQRLKVVRDRDNKILSENEYHYRTQN